MRLTALHEILNIEKNCLTEVFLRQLLIANKGNFIEPCLPAIFLRNITFLLNLCKKFY